jgi:hypothetical protein
MASTDSAAYFAQLWRVLRRRWFTHLKTAVIRSIVIVGTTAYGVVAGTSSPRWVAIVGALVVGLVVELFLAGHEMWENDQASIERIKNERDKAILESSSATTRLADTSEQRTIRALRRIYFDRSRTMDGAGFLLEVADHLGGSGETREQLAPLLGVSTDPRSDQWLAFGGFLRSLANEGVINQPNSPSERVHFTPQGNEIRRILQDEQEVRGSGVGPDAAP